MNEETYKRTDLVHVRWELDESVARAEERARIVVKLRNLAYDAGSGSPEGMALDDAADQLDAEAAVVMVTEEMVLECQRALNTAPRLTWETSTIVDFCLQWMADRVNGKIARIDP